MCFTKLLKIGKAGLNETSRILKGFSKQLADRHLIVTARNFTGQGMNICAVRNLASYGSYWILKRPFMLQGDNANFNSDSKHMIKLGLLPMSTLSS